MSAAVENPTSPAAISHYGSIAAIAAALLFLVILVLPGFVAGIWSRITHVETLSHLSYASQPPAQIDYFLIAATRLNRVPGFSQLYQWEYDVAGGIPKTPVASISISTPPAPYTGTTTSTFTKYKAPSRGGTLFLKGSSSYTGAYVLPASDLQDWQRYRGNPYGELSFGMILMEASPPSLNLRNSNITFDIRPPSRPALPQAVPGAGTITLNDSYSNIMPADAMKNYQVKEYGTLTVGTVTLHPQPFSSSGNLPTPGDIIFDVTVPFPSFPPISSPDYRWMPSTGQHSAYTP